MQILKESSRRFATSSIKPRNEVYAASNFYKCRKNYLIYSYTQHILSSNLLMYKLMQVCCSEIENENSRVAAINSVSTYFLYNY